MEDEKKYHLSILNLALRMALKGALAYISIFLFMKLIGLANIYHLRYVNTLVLFLITLHTLKEIDSRTRHHLEYLTGLGVCLFLAIISFSIFAFFMFFYLSFWDPSFMNYLKGHAPFGRYLTPINASVWIIIEGLGIQLAFTLIIMEYFKWMQSKLHS